MLLMRFSLRKLNYLQVFPLRITNVFQSDRLGFRRGKTTLALSQMRQQNFKTSSAIGILRNDDDERVEVLRKGDYEWQEPKNEDETVNIVFMDKHGNKTSTIGKVGVNLMYLAQKYDLEIEGACGGFAQCCTCHVYIDPDYMEKLPEPEIAEEDMLDKAAFLKENSRLCCQVVLSKEHDGLQVTLPPATVNFYVDGHVPKHH